MSDGKVGIQALVAGAVRAGAISIIEKAKSLGLDGQMYGIIAQSAINRGLAKCRAEGDNAGIERMMQSQAALDHVLSIWKEVETKMDAEPKSAKDRVLSHLRRINLGGQPEQTEGQKIVEDTLTFGEELKTLINKYSRENNSNTPDFILAEFMCNALNTFETYVKARDNWYGIAPVPGVPFEDWKVKR